MTVLNETFSDARFLDAIFFDLDGCLVDSTRAITNTFHHTLLTSGIAPRSAEVTRSFIGPPLRATFDRVVVEEGLDPAFASVLVATYRARYGAMSASETTMFPGILEALAKLREYAPLAIVTSKFGPVAEKLVDEIGLRAHIAIVYAPRDDHTIEPKEVTLRRALAATGARPHATVMIGDRDSTADIVDSLGIYRALPQGEFEVLPRTPHPFEKVPLKRLSVALLDYFLLN